MKHKKKLIQEVLTSALLDLSKELYENIQISRIELNQKSTLIEIYYLGNKNFFLRFEKLGNYFRKYIARQCNFRLVPEVRIKHDEELTKQLKALEKLDKVLKSE